MNFIIIYTYFVSEYRLSIIAQMSLFLRHLANKLISAASFSRPASRRFPAPFSRMLTRRYRMIPQKSGAEMARIRRPGTRELYPPASKTLSPFPLPSAVLHHFRREMEYRF